eukprot:2298722-Rhodomonas_salina.5
MAPQPPALALAQAARTRRECVRGRGEDEGARGRADRTADPASQSTVREGGSAPPPCRIPHARQEWVT